MRKLFVSAAAFAALCAVRAEACDAIIASSPIVFLGNGSGYESFDPARRTQAVQLRVRKTSSAACTVFVTASASGTVEPFRQLAAGANRLNYNLYLNATRTLVWKDITPRSTTNAFVRSFAAGPGETTFTYFFDIPPQQVVRPTAASGFYLQEVTFSLYTAATGGTPVASVPVIHQTAVPAAIEVSFGGSPFTGTPGPQTMAFGNLSAGQVQTLAMLVRGNNGFDVRMSTPTARMPVGSAAMKFDPPAADASEVPYTLSVSGTPADLSGAVPVVSTNELTSLMGAALPIQVTIGNFGLATAGNYKDVVNITVRSK
jgi:spore coat protein U-like protein